MTKIYEQAVTTHRSANMLAIRHGFENIVQLAEFLPQSARVIDVGSGASPFGKEVATLRPDITWVNLDYSYHDQAILDEVNNGAPSNLHNIAGDATKLCDLFEEEEFDAAFSSSLIMHLSLDDDEPALQMAEHLYTITKEGGLISVGPESNTSKWPSIRTKKSVQVVKNSSQMSKEEYAKYIVGLTSLSYSGKRTQRAVNEVITESLGTNRWIKNERRLPRIYHPGSGEYVSPLSPRGVHTLGSLAVRFLKYYRSEK